MLRLIKVYVLFVFAVVTTNGSLRGLQWLFGKAFKSVPATLELPWIDTKVAKWWDQNQVWSWCALAIIAVLALVASYAIVTVENWWKGRKLAKAQAA